MNRRLKKSASIAGWGLAIVVVAALCAAVGMYVLSLRIDDYREQIAQRLSDELALEIRLDGALEVVFGRRLEIEVDGARVLQPGVGEVARVAALEIEIDILRVLREGELNVAAVRAREGVVTLPFEIAGTHELDIASLDLRPLLDETARVEVSASGRLANIGIEIDGTLVPRRAWTGPVREGADPPFSGHFALGIGDLRATLDGRLGLPLVENSVDVAFLVESQGLEPLLALVEAPGFVDLQALGRIQARGRLVHGPDDLALEDLAVGIGLEPDDPGGGDRLDVHGGIHGLTSEPVFDLSLELSTSDAERFIERFDLTADGATLGTGRCTLRGSASALELRDIDITLAHETGLNSTLTGIATRTGAVWQLDLPLNIEAPNAGAMLDTMSVVVGPVRDYLQSAPLLQHEAVRSFGPVHIQATARATYDEHFAARLDPISVEVGARGDSWAHVSGRVQHLLPSARGVSLDLKIDSPRGIPILEVVGPDYPRLLDVAGHARVSDETGALRLYQYEATGVAEGDVRISVSGDELDPFDPGEFELALSVQAESFAAVGRLLGVPIPPVGPVRIDSRIDRNPARLRADELRLSVGQSQLSGHFVLEQPVDRAPRLTLVGRSESARLADLGIGSVVRGAAGGHEASGEGKDGDAEGFDWDAPLPLEGLSAVDGTLDLQFRELTGQDGLRLGPIGISLGLEDGLLATNEIQLTWQGGDMGLEGRIDTRSDPPSAELRIHGKDIDFDQLLSQYGAHGAAEGLLAMNLDVVSQGRTPRALIAGLDGRVYLQLGAGRVATKYSHAMQLNYASRLDPGKIAPEYEKTHCIVGHFDLHDEKLNLDSVFFDSDEKQVLATGEVSLADGQLSLLLTPRFKQGVPDSVSAAIRVSGSVRDPKAMIEPFATASATTRGLIDRALGPVRRVLPVLSDSVDDVRRAADRAAAAAGSDAAAHFWSTTIDLECEEMTASIRKEAMESGDRPIRDLLSQPLRLVPGQR